MGVDLGKILVATDGSENADYALNIAIKIAEKYSSRVDLVYVRQPRDSPLASQVVDPVIGASTMIIPSQVVPSEPKEDQTGTKDKKDKTGNLLEDRLSILRDRNIESSAFSPKSPDVGGEILRIARSGGYNLVVLGSRGMSGLKSLILGSVSTKVAKEARCSVLVMKRRISGALKILLGYDGSDESKKALDFLTDFGKKFNAEVDPISLVNVPIAPEGVVGADVDRWEREMREEVDEAVYTLRASGIRAEGKVAEFVDVPKALSDEAEKGSYDLIAVGNRGMGRLKSLFLGSVASGVTNSAKTNVLIVRS